MIMPSPLSDRTVLLTLLLTLLLIFGIVLGLYANHDEQLPNLEWQSPLISSQGRTPDT
ncbi:hypothetical protein OMCYN_01212 [cyanobiont of Ornithocercus magnificus]|nr:hypothetical protein OMCYN_01212 [cyanobiont of Ornithocercus magnificus]